MSQGDQFDWIKIKALYEAGESAYSISQRPGMPSRQAICVHAKEEGWEVSHLPERRLDSLPVVLGKLTPENRVVAVEYAAYGLSKSVIATRLGVARNTLNNWLSEDEQFAQAMEAARGEHVARQYQRIDEAADRDWRAADRLLQVHPLTRDEWGKAAAGMVGNTFNILADFRTGITRGRTIEQE